jgi:hypothetical protein
MPRPSIRRIPGPVTFNPGELEDDLLARVDTLPPDRAGMSRVGQRDLARYYYHINLALSHLTFTQAEASLIVDVMNGTLTEPHTAALLWASVDDALEDGYAAKWGVDGKQAQALVARLRALTPFESLAICDACERFWNRVAAGREETNEERLRAVGLLR